MDTWILSDDELIELIMHTLNINNVQKYENMLLIYYWIEIRVFWAYSFSKPVIKTKNKKKCFDIDFFLKIISL